MWFDLGVENLIVKKALGVDFSDVFICDFNRVWHKSLSDNELLTISKRLNPLLEAKVEKLKDVTLNLLVDAEVEKKIYQSDASNDILLKLQSNIMGVKFKFEFLLQQADGDMFYKEFTMPLLNLLMKIQQREEKLIKVIEEKDAEIEDYKQEYGAKSNYLSTQPFNKNEFDSLEFQKFSSFLNCITAKALSIESKPKIKKEEEEESQKKEFETESSTDKCDTNKPIFKDKSSNLNRGSKPCVILENQILKKRKKQDGFKIKF